MTMARRALFLITCVATVVYSAVATVETATPTASPVFHEYEGCSQKCEGSYSPHTNPDVVGLDACQRGCRLSLIASVSGKPNASSLCHKGCHKGYSNDVVRKFACEVGCSNNDWDRTREEMLAQEMYTYMMMSSFMHFMREQLLSSLQSMHQPQSVDVYVAAGNPSGVLIISSEIEEVQPQQLETPADSQRPEHRHDRWGHGHTRLFHWIFMLSLMGILAYFLSFMCDIVSAQSGDAKPLPEKKSLLIENVPTIRRSVPVVPPGKLVEVVVTEV